MSRPIAKSTSTMQGVRLLFAVWLVATAAGTIFPDLRVWGVHLPAFLPIWGQIAFFGAAVLFLVSPTRLFDKSWGTVSRWIFSFIRTPLPAVLLVAAFIIFRVGAALLGDSMLRGGEPELGKYNPTEILPGYLASVLYTILHPLFDLRGREVVAVISIIAGCGFLFLVWHYPRRIWDKPKDQMLARVVLTFGSVTALFFGYVESYAIPCAAMIGYLLAAEAYRRGKGGFLIAAAFFVLAVASHLAAVVLLPSLIVLSLNLGQRRRWRPILTGVIGLVAIGWGLWAVPSNIFARGAASGSVLIPLLPQPPSNYGLFSASHWLDLANLLCLVVPGVLIGAPLFFTRGKRVLKTGLRFFWPLAVIIPLGIPLFIDPKLGMARDWDLMTLGLLPLLVFWAIHLADIRIQLPRSAIRLPIFASVTVLALFVGINAHAPTAVSRFEKLVELDAARGGYGYEMLAYYYHTRGEIDRVIRSWQRALELEENGRYWMQLSTVYRQQGDQENALASARRCFFTDTTSAAGAYFLANTYNNLGLSDSVLHYLDWSARLAPDNDEVQHDLAATLYARGQIEDAHRHIITAIELAPDKAKYHNVLGAILIQTGRFDEAIPIFGRALELHPGYKDSRLNLAMAYYLNGQPQLAMAELTNLSRQSALTREEKNEIIELTRRIRPADSTEDIGD
ncbi:tetratricopeptide repeat protein [Candidatus Zixiibacteriota bacterium]